MEKRKSRLKWVLLGVLGLLVAGAGVAVLRLDALLNAQVRKVTAELSVELGRPVEVGKVATRLLPPMGAVVSQVSVGPAQGESRPLTTIDRISVKVDAWKALQSQGKDLHVLDAEVAGLVVNVERLSDGTTNVERLLERLDARSPQKDEAPTEEQPASSFDLSGVKVDRAALVDGRFALLDSTATPPKELAISDLDVELLDLRVGQPLEVTLKAAVLGAAQNLEASLKTSPLTAELDAVPVSFALRAKDIDLGPLGPFLGKDVGLQAGTFNADWKASLGSAVPGGAGDTTFVGEIAALGLQFDAAEGGKSLDVRIATDVTANLQEGSAKLAKLGLEAGPAKLTGKGEVKGLLSGAPQVEGFEVVMPPFSVDTLAEHYPPLNKMLKGRLGGSVGMTLRGEGSADAQTLVADLDLTGARLRVKDQLSKAPGGPLTVKAVLSGAAAAQTLRFDATAELGGVDLRPGGLLNKAPGQTLALKAKGTYASKGSATSVQLESFELNALADTLKGKAKVELGAGGNPDAIAFMLDAQAPTLDADALLMDDEKDEPAPSAQGGATTAGAAEAPKDPTRFNGMKGELALRIGALRFSEYDLKNVVVVMKMVDDLITLERMQAGVFGGQVIADGTNVRIAPPKRPYHAKLKLEQVDIAQALVDRVPERVLTGRVSGEVELNGVGYEKEDLLKSLTGMAKGRIEGGSYTGLDVVSKLSNSLGAALPFGSPKQLTASRATSLGDVLPFGLVLEQGVARLKDAIQVDTKQSALSVDGGIKLDGNLALNGTAALKPTTVATLTRGKVRLDAPLPIPFKLVGPAWSPRLEEVDVKPAAKMLLEKAGQAVLGKVLGDKAADAERLAREKAAAVQAEVDARKREAEAKVAAERAKAEAAAKKKADEAKRKAEEAAKNKLKGVFGR